MEQPTLEELIAHWSRRKARKMIERACPDPQPETVPEPDQKPEGA